MRPTRRKPPKAGIRKTVPRRYPGHLQFVRGHECAAKNEKCDGRIEACHVRGGTDGGMAEKPSDWWALPLCSFHHKQQHDLGEPKFQRLHKFDMKDAATSYARASNDIRIRICAGRKVEDIGIGEIDA